MSSMLSKIEKPWSVDQFEEFRPHMCSFVRSQVVPLLNQTELKRLLIHGQVKVGRERNCRVHNCSGFSQSIPNSCIYFLFPQKS